MARRARPRPRSGRDAPTESLLLRDLLHAFYWFDDGLQAHMRRVARFSLPPAQSMMMVCIGEGVTRQSDLAAALRVSKQAVQQGVKALVAKGLIALEPDPEDGRQRRVVFTARGQAMRELTRDGLARLESELARRIGTTRLARLREVLAADWGDVPATV